MKRSRSPDPVTNDYSRPHPIEPCVIGTMVLFGSIFVAIGLDGEQPIEGIVGGLLLGFGAGACCLLREQSRTR